MTVRIELRAYDAAWPALHAREEAAIRGALRERALRVEHAGSTAVPGLAAKPVVDIVLVVADTRDERAYVPALEAIGYELRIREPAWYEHRLLRAPGDASAAVNLHVFPEACPEVERMVAFRDRLRTSAEERALYERVKRELARRSWATVQAYADAKAEVVAEILGRAR